MLVKFKQLYSHTFFMINDERFMKSEGFDKSGAKKSMYSMDGEYYNSKDGEPQVFNAIHFYGHNFGGAVVIQPDDLVEVNTMVYKVMTEEQAISFSGMAKFQNLKVGAYFEYEGNTYIKTQGFNSDGVYVSKIIANGKVVGELLGSNSEYDTAIVNGGVIGEPHITHPDLIVTLGGGLASMQAFSDEKLAEFVKDELEIYEESARSLDALDALFTYSKQTLKQKIKIVDNLLYGDVSVKPNEQMYKFLENERVSLTIQREEETKKREAKVKEKSTISIDEIQAIRNNPEKFLQFVETVLMKR